MLTVTETAASAIKELLEENDLPEGAGMRITGEIDENQEAHLELGFDAPSEGDVTFTTDSGVNVYLDEAAAAALEGKVLDAEPHGDHVHFSIGEQQG
jgi:iron-sulfur cluster assembly protein